MPKATRTALPARDPGRLVALADQCVQCGLCLPACPTYRLERLETESPRGRIALARGWALDLASPTPAGDAHLDHCLGCRSCEAVCPAGVRYGPLLVEARTAQRERRPPGWRQRLLEALAARPRLLSRALATYRHSFQWLPASLRPLPRPPRPERPAFAGQADTALFLGCVARGYEPSAQAAIVRLAAALGIKVAAPAGQTCCGTLHAHAGNAAGAEACAARNRDAFAGHGTVLTLATGCHEAVAAALAPGSEAADALAFLAARAAGLRFRPRPERVALHLPCTQRNVVRSDGATRALLAHVPGLEVVELHAGTGCCGAAGTRMLDEPARAVAHRAPLLEQFAASGASRLLSANIGCRLHFANGTRLPVQHPLEFLADCLEGPPA
jgi:glycolate oxidase iron-sulfur subunit